MAIFVIVSVLVVVIVVVVEEIVRGEFVEVGREDRRGLGGDGPGLTTGPEAAGRRRWRGSRRRDRRPVLELVVVGQLE